METRNSKRTGSRNIEDLKRKPLKQQGKTNLYPKKALLNEEEEEEIEMDFEEEIENDFEEEKMENDKKSPVAEISKSSFSKPHSEDKNKVTYKELNEKVSRMRKQHNREKQAPSLQTKTPKIINQSSQMNRESLGSSCLKSCSLWVIGLLCLIVGAAGLVLRPILNSQQPKLDVEGIMSGLKDRFAGQDPMTFKVVERALKRVNQPEPEAPAIIILLAGKSAKNLSHDFAQQLVRAISPDYLNISGDDYHGVSTDIGKKDIDDRIRNGLNEDELKAVLVGNLDHIPSQTAIMFYSFCDHENAPYKRVVYVMTLTSQQDFSKKYNDNAWDNAVQDHLLTVWNDTHEDKITPLLSRLTVSVAAITEDK